MTMSQEVFVFGVTRLKP